MILKENVLEFEAIYSFRLIIEQYNANNIRIGYGESTAVKISVLSQPMIIDNSFKI